jgi:hypothetical protein
MKPLKNFLFEAATKQEKHYIAPTEKSKWGEEEKNKRKGKKTSDLGDSAHLDHGC